MRRSIIFLAIALLIAFGFAMQNTSAGYSAPKDGEARVWVEFKPGQKSSVEKALRGAGAQFHYTFADLNAFVVSLPAAAIQGISRNPNVVSIEEDALRYPDGQTVPYGIDMVQARDVWDANRDNVVDAGAPTGAGRLVCIIDSGLEVSHEDFDGVNITGGYPAGWNTDTCGHGTHVAGTIAAANNTLGVVGVTPGAVSLYIVKVFDGEACGWSYSSTLIDAAQRCQAAGANIISMSLGGATKSKLEERAFNNLYAAGILSIAAAGNDGTTALHYPASYASVVSVAAIDSSKVIADFSQQNSAVELAAPGVGVLSTVPWLSTNSLTVDGVTYEANHIDYAPYTNASGSLVNGGLCDATGSWSGKVVLCERGVISFYDKVMNVQNSGGAAAVIYNNEPGNFLGTLGDGMTSTIPAISLSQEDGQYLVVNKLGSSGSVVSSFDPNGSGYEAWDGTSMATPHVSGVAALIWSFAPTQTNAQIRTAMTATAEDLGVAGKDNAYGYGLVQAYDAWVYLGGGIPTPTPDPTPTPTPTPTPDPGEDSIHVSAIDMWYTKVSRKYTVYTQVTIVNQGNVPVSGATVTISLAIPGGSTATGTATTGTDGTVIFSYTSKNVGTYTSSVTNVTHSTYSYNASANAETSESLTVP